MTIIFMTLSGLFCLLLGAKAVRPSFTIANDGFEKDGESFILMSGSFHYHRTDPPLWKDRLTRMAAMGLNAVQTYVPWNFHSSAPGSFDFTSRGRDLPTFLRVAQDAGLLVLLRPGPYICGEHDFGGLPAYLLNTEGINSVSDLRTNNTQYLEAVKEWWTTLLPLVSNLTYSNGGPIAMVQIENEFGSFGNTAGSAGDAAYMIFLKSLASAILPGTLLYTTDGNSAGYMTHGTISGLFATGDGSAPPWAADGFNPKGQRAHIDSELYTGWLTHWGDEHAANTTAMDAVSMVSRILASSGSFNLYMATGGTNFGFWNGANGGGSQFQPVITSYDYDAPISEGGGHGFGPDGDKYMAFQNLLSYWSSSKAPPLPSEPPAPAVTTYGKVVLGTHASFLDNLEHLSKTVARTKSDIPTMEKLGQAQGYVLYSCALPPFSGTVDSYQLTITGAADYAQVFLQGQPQGVVYRPVAAPINLDAQLVKAGAKLDILVENMGHLNYGRSFFDPKGITGEVLVNGVPLSGNWTVYSIPLDFKSISSLSFSNADESQGPSFHRGTLNLPNSTAPTDSYVAMCGWHKGQVFVNGFHLGRYWEDKGPQHSFYVPSSLLKAGFNDILLLEQHSRPKNKTISFIDRPDFTGEVCTHSETIQPTKMIDLGPQKTNFSSSCPSPAVGSPASLQPCDSVATPANNSQWLFVPVAQGARQAHATAGMVVLASNTSLCLLPHGANPQSGSPAMTVGKCDASDRSTHLLYFPQNNNALLSPVIGSCVDVTGGGTAVGTLLEYYSCTGGTNQAFKIVPVHQTIAQKKPAKRSGVVVQIVGIESKFCVASC